MSAISKTVTIGNGHYKLFSREAGASLNLVVTSTAKKSLRSTERRSLKVLTVL